jgi:hypothetical protein
MGRLNFGRAREEPNEVLSSPVPELDCFGLARSRVTVLAPVGRLEPILRSKIEAGEGTA